MWTILYMLCGSAVRGYRLCRVWYCKPVYMHNLCKLHNYVAPTLHSAITKYIYMLQSLFNIDTYSCHSAYSILLLGTGDGFASSLLSPPGQGGSSFPTSLGNLIPLCLPQKWATIFELQGVGKDLWWHPFTCPGTICTTHWRGNVLGRQELTKCYYGTFCCLLCLNLCIMYVCIAFGPVRCWPSPAKDHSRSNYQQGFLGSTEPERCLCEASSGMSRHFGENS